MQNGEQGEDTSGMLDNRISFHRHVRRDIADGMLCQTVTCLGTENMHVLTTIEPSAKTVEPGSLDSSRILTLSNT